MRLRTCFRLTDSIMIDLGADAVVQAMKYGDLSGINHVLVTHTHDDHLNPHMLMECFWAKDHRETLHYYFTDKAFEIVDHWRKSPWILKGRVREFEEKGYVAFHQLQFGERIEIDNIGITPFRGNHTAYMLSGHMQTGPIMARRHDKPCSVFYYCLQRPLFARLSWNSFSLRPSAAIMFSSTSISELISIACAVNSRSSCFSKP